MLVSAMHITACVFRGARRAADKRVIVKVMGI